MRYLITLLAVFAMLLSMEASALCQTQPTPWGQTLEDKRGPEPASASSNEDESAVEPAKEFPDASVSLAAASLPFDKESVVRLYKSANIPESDKLVRSQTRSSAPAQTQAPQAAPPQGGEDAAALAKQLNNPIASLISLPFQMNWDTGVGPNRDVRNTLNIQPVMPFKLNDDWNLIARLIMPVLSQPALVPGGETKFGLSDFLFSAFFTPARPKGVIWGIGPAILVPVTSEPNLGTEKLAIGPTGVLIKQTGGWTIGVLGNHLWSIAGADDRADVNQTFLQPVLNYTTRKAWTFGLSSEITMNWEANPGEKVTAPAVFSITKLLRLGGQAISLGPGIGYFIDQPGNGPRWRGRFTFTLLYPIKK